MTGYAQFNTEDITAPDLDVEIDLTVRGPEDEAETVHMHAHDEIVKALQAINTEQNPDACAGLPWDIDFERRLEIISGEAE